MKQYIIFIIISLLSSNVVLSQTANDVFEGYISAKKNEKEYQTKINYALYKNLDTDKVYESYKGLQARYNGVTYQKIGAMELAQGLDFVVKLNTSEKAMLVGLSSKQLYKDYSQIDNMAILELFENKTLEDMGAHWKLILSSQQATLNQFSKIEFILNKKDLMLVKQILFYDSVTDFSIYNNDNEEAKDKKAAELAIPRLEITYEDYKDVVDINKDLFNKSRYFTHANNKILASNNYKGFEILLSN